MAWQAARAKQHGIQADAMLPITWMAPQPVFHRVPKASSLPCGHRTLCFLERAALLDLDERQAASTHSDEINLAVGTAMTAVENAVTLEKQQYGGDQF